LGKCQGWAKVRFRVKVRVEVMSKVAWFLAMKDKRLDSHLFSNPTPNLNPYNNLDLNLTFTITLTLGLSDSNGFPCLSGYILAQLH
jgi:hypothetical protein